MPRLRMPKWNMATLLNYLMFVLKFLTLGTSPSRVVALYMDVNLTKLAFTVDGDSRHSQVGRLNHMCRAFRSTQYCDMSEVFLSQ